MIVGLLWKWGIVTAVFMACATAHPKISVRSWGTAVGAAGVFGVANVVVGWLVGWILTVVLFLPAVLTLGLAYLLIPVAVNMLLLAITDRLVGDDFKVEGLGALASMAATMAVATFVLFRLVA